MRKIFGIAGNMGTGKSTLVKELAKYCHLNIIELDDLRRYALWESIEPKHVNLRQQLAGVFNLDLTNGWLDRDKFTKTLFSSPENLDKYRIIATCGLKADTQEKIESTSLHTAVVWAWLLEEHYTDLLNSFVILTYSFQERLLEALDTENLKQRRSLEPTYSSRLLYKNKFEIIEFDNSAKLNHQAIQILAEKING